MNTTKTQGHHLRLVPPDGNDVPTRRRRIHKEPIKILVNRMIKEYATAPSQVSSYAVIGDLKTLIARAIELQPGFKVSAKAKKRLRPCQY